MPLNIVTTEDQRLVGAPALAALRKAVGEKGRATLLVPDFDRQLDACRELAAQGLSLGVTVTTPGAWVRERWQVWGDGTNVVEPLARTVALQSSLAAAAREDAPDAPAYNAGTVRVLSTLASAALPWVPLRGDGTVDPDALLALGLTRAEANVVRVLDRYVALLSESSYTEESVAMASVVERVCAAGAQASLWPTVLAGFDDLPKPQRELALSLAAHTDVTAVFLSANEAAAAGAARAASYLEDACAQRGTPCAHTGEKDGAPESTAAPESAGATASARVPELRHLLEALFRGDERIAAEGAVSLALPAGPLAEAEAVTQEVLSLEADGCRSVVVVAPDTVRAWRELVPKLVARGCSVRGRVSLPAASLEALRAYLEFASSVAVLAELDATWPEPERTEEGTIVHLGDMSWWPPRHVTDFLLCDVAHVPTARAWNLDRAWRSNRLLTPADVLRTLQNPGATSPEVAAATRELLRGRLGSAASKLLQPYVAQAASAAPAAVGEKDGARPVDYVTDDDGNVAVTWTREDDPMADVCAMGSLLAVLNVAGTLKELGFSADPKAEDRVPLADLVRRAQEALAGVSVRLRPGVAAKVAAPVANVQVMGPADAARLAAGSVDAVIVCGQSAAESPVEPADDVASALTEAICREPAPDTMAQARARFWRQLAAARRHVTLERSGNDAASKPRYPSVMLTELLACYDAADDGTSKSEKDEHDDTKPKRVLACRVQAETEAVANLSPSGTAPSKPVAREGVAPAGRVTDAAARALINVPVEGKPELLDGKPYLSASQIESYLECPYKWFSLRRLRLRDSDAGFGPMEMGTFAHHVMEVTHRTLLEEGLAAMEARGEVAPDVSRDLTTRVPGSRVSLDNPAGLEHAKGLLRQTLAADLRAQFVSTGRHDRDQAFVPHTAQDEGQLRTLERDLCSALDYEAGLLTGFEPRLFEWDFGHKGDLVEYAGAWLNGTVDRVDVDPHGGAVVIDYKHKGFNGFAREYAAFSGADDGDGGAPFSLPRRVQALIYAQVVRRHFPNLAIRGATYLNTRGQDHVLAGAVDEGQMERVFGVHQPKKAAAKAMAVERNAGFGTEHARGMDALLDATEEAIRAAVARMMEGDIEAAPVDASACEHCPVMNCERKITK